MSLLVPRPVVDLEHGGVGRARMIYQQQQQQQSNRHADPLAIQVASTKTFLLVP